MKKCLLSLFALAVALSAQAQAFRADDPVGTTLHYGYVDKKGNPTSEATFKLVNRADSPQGTVLDILMESVVDGMPARADLKMTYTGDQIILDKSFLMSNTIMEQGQKYKDARITATGDDPTMPVNPKIGDELSNYTLYLSVAAPDNVVVNTKASTTSRKITGKEEVTTPAGTFDAFVLEEDVFSTVNIMGININATGKGKSWVVPGMGIVKQDNANKKGKSTGGYQLVKIVYPE